MAAVYYFVFRWAIGKFNLLTPGRGDADSNRLITKDEYQQKTGIAGGNAPNQKALDVLAALGGKANINILDACITRLRVGVNDKANVNKDLLKALGAAGVLEVGNGIQAIFGPTSDVLRGQIQDIIDSGGDSLPGQQANNAKTPAEEESATKTAQSTSANPADVGEVILVAPLSGEVVAIEEVPDQVFSEKMMGDGIAIIPFDGALVSPVDGEIVSVFPSKHALTLKSAEGVELLIHMGIDTVRLDGEGFDIFVAEGQKVKKGDQLGTFDIEKVKAAGYNTITPIIVANSDQFKLTEQNTNTNVTAGKGNLMKASSSR